MSEDARAELEKRWTQLGLGDEDLTPRANGTIIERGERAPQAVEPAVEAPAPATPGTAETVQVPSSGPSVPTAAAPQISPTPSLVGMPAVAPDAIVIGPALGGGGMGIVHVAEQPSLRREVAVKVLREERRTGTSVSALLREAWVMGTLEHPNIVPVHLLLREDDGSPRVVMKRIEGVAWDAIIEAPTLIQSLSDGAAGAPAGNASTRQEDPLEFHLRVLISVCHAVAFAHSRGILHLDLKPDNVMIGYYGEVAVLDWGIAASFGDRAPRWLPQASLIRGVRGTPAWMAPELAAADGERIGTHTDVYLLGGLLHAVLTGTVRHDGPEVKDILAAAYVSEPYVYGAEVPAELAALANRATARAPGDRPPSAEAFRRALEAFLGHRASTTLSDEAVKKMAPLLVRLAGPSDAAASSADGIRRDFLECQFAFRQALQIWMDNPVARDGLQVLLRGMAEHALRNRQLERAAECLHAMRPSDPELSRRLADLAREALDDQQRLRSLERDADPNVNYRSRRLMALATGLLFISWNLVIGWLNRTGMLRFTLEGLVWFNLMTIGLFSLGAFTVRNTMLTAAPNRRLVVLFGSGFMSVLAYWVGALLLARARPDLALEPLDVVATTHWVYIYFVLSLAFTMDARAAWLVLPSAAIAVVAPMERDLAFELLGLSGFIVGTGLFFIWLTPSRGKRRTEGRPSLS